MGALTVGPDRDGRVVHAVGGRIVAEAPADAVVLACADAVIEPGRVDAHTHLYSGLAPLGMPAADPPPTCFLEILERVWWRLDRALTAESLAAAAELYVAEALLLGTTSLVDHHESPNLVAGSLDVLADAIEGLGARALLCYGATERNRGPAEAAEGLAECARFVRERRSPRLRGLVGLHASFTVGDATVREAGALCRELGVPLHVHVAEDGADVVDARERGYAGPLERLLALDALPAGAILAHGVHLSREQVALADEHGWWWVHNPRSNEGNRVGFAASLDAAERVALGTDGWTADMAVERDAAVRLGVSAEEASARLGRGHALIAERFGADPTPLASGAVADLVVRGPEGVRQVVVEGELVVDGGRLVRGDLDAIRARATVEANALWQRLQPGVRT